MAKSGKYCNLLDCDQLSTENKTDASRAPITQWLIISPETILELLPEQ